MHSQKGTKSVCFIVAFQHWVCFGRGIKRSRMHLTQLPPPPCAGLVMFREVDKGWGEILYHNDTTLKHMKLESQLTSAIGLQIISDNCFYCALCHMLNKLIQIIAYHNLWCSPMVWLITRRFFEQITSTYTGKKEEKDTPACSDNFKKWIHNRSWVISTPRNSLILSTGSAWLKTICL